MHPTWVTHRLQKPRPAGGSLSCPHGTSSTELPPAVSKLGTRCRGAFCSPTHSSRRTRAGKGPCPPRRDPSAQWCGAPHTRPTLRARPSWTQRCGRGSGLQFWLPCPPSWVAWGKWLSLSVPPFLQRKMEGILGKLLGERPVCREGALAITAHGRCISGPGEYTSGPAAIREHGGALD